MDSQEFEEIFDVYSSDPIEAMQLLTADIMQSLIKFYNEIQVKYEFTIKGNNIYLRFRCVDMFEAPTVRKFSLDKETIYRYYKILNFVFELSDEVVKTANQMHYN